MRATAMRTMYLQAPSSCSSLSANPSVHDALLRYDGGIYAVSAIKKNFYTDSCEVLRVNCGENIIMISDDEYGLGAL